MRRFLVEAYTPSDSSIGELDGRARRAAGELSGAGTPVHYERAIFVPEDETCFYVLAATSRQDAAEVMRRAGVSAQRVTEAVRADVDSEEEQ
jgi:hypothetical protein